MANLNEVKKYHFIYKTTNLLSGKFYIGMHSTSNLKDGYLGSGKRLRRSIRKYGKENFKTEILEWYDTRFELTAREKELVNEDLLKDPMCMNLMYGGEGGFISVEQQKTRSLAGSKKLHKRREIDKDFDDAWREKLRISTTKRIKDGELKNWQAYYSWKNKKHSEEAKVKIGKANSIKQKGKANSQYGTYWITNGTENRKIHYGDTLPYGYRIGRVIKKWLHSVTE